MIALGGPKLKLYAQCRAACLHAVSMIALGGPKLKPQVATVLNFILPVSMIALGGPKLKRRHGCPPSIPHRFQ